MQLQSSAGSIALGKGHKTSIFLAESCRKDISNKSWYDSGCLAYYTYSCSTIPTGTENAGDQKMRHTWRSSTFPSSISQDYAKLRETNNNIEVLQIRHDDFRHCNCISFILPLTFLHVAIIFAAPAIGTLYSQNLHFTPPLTTLFHTHRSFTSIHCFFVLYRPLWSIKKISLYNLHKIFSWRD